MFFIISGIVMTTTLTNQQAGGQLVEAGDGGGVSAGAAVEAVTPLEAPLRV